MFRMVKNQLPIKTFRFRIVSLRKKMELTCSPTLPENVDIGHRQSLYSFGTLVGPTINGCHMLTLRHKNQCSDTTHATPIIQTHHYSTKLAQV